MPKPVLLLAIDDFGIGGAEMLITGILPELNRRYEVVIVNLTPKSDFVEADIPCTYRYFLGYSGKLSLPLCAWRMRRIIRKHKPVLVHAHLLISSLIARVACPANIPLAFTIHNLMSRDAFDNSRLLTLLEKWSIRSGHAIIAVSADILEDYERVICKMPHQFVLKNFIEEVFLTQPVQDRLYQPGKELKLVAVGNVKPTKNYGYLVEAFLRLKGLPVSLDIYGYFQEEIVKELQAVIEKNRLPVRFMGKTEKIHEVLPKYDAYVMSSKYEGFGIAAVEAMALGLPLLLSDLKVLREVTFNHALFFDVSSPAYFAELVREVMEGKHDLNRLSVEGVSLARNHYSKKAYLDQLFAIYHQLERKDEAAAV